MYWGTTVTLQVISEDLYLPVIVCYRIDGYLETVKHIDKFRKLPSVRISRMGMHLPPPNL